MHDGNRHSSLYQSTRILNAYMEVLTEFIHVFCPDVSITLYYLKAVSLKQLLVSGRQAE